MLYRVRQFLRGIFAEGITAEERRVLGDVLPEAGWRLFLRMNKADQRHSLNVLQTARGLWQEWDLAGVGEFAEASEAKKLLMRCCLLHDIGRGRSMGPIRKSVAVLLDSFFPHWAREQGKCASGSYIGDILHRYYHHAELSRDLLMANGFGAEGEIVALHHQEGFGNLSPRDKIILQILRKADALN